MTNEEMKELKGLAASMGLYDDKNPCKRAVILGKAIKALEQQPCEDAISRENAIIRISWDFPTLEISKVKESLDKLPSVTPQSKTGHWMKKEDDTCWWYVCSECEQEPLKNRWNDDDVLSTFCPNCGAKMVEPQESERTL